MIARAIPTVLLLLSAASSGQARQHHAWRITYLAGLRIENGVETPLWLDATLRVAARGESLVATLVTDTPAGGPPRPTRRSAARTPSGPDVTFETRSKAAFRSSDGGDHDLDVVNTWVVRPRGGASDAHSSATRSTTGCWPSPATPAASRKAINS
jgi:hypothetical protein